MGPTNMRLIFSMFESKAATAVCLLLAVVNRVINVFFVSYTGRDEMILVMQSKSFLAGHGLCIPKYYTTQLDFPLYDCTQLWPPGYAITLAPFLKIFNYNIYGATTTLEILASLAMIFIIRKLCSQAGFPLIAKNLMTLIAGCFEYPFIYESQPTDTLSLIFLLAGISYTLTILNQNSFSLIQILVAALLFFLPVFYRYAYPPVSLVIIFSIIICGWIVQNKLWVKKGIAMAGMLSILFVIFFITLKLSTGQSAYITKTERGIYPENLVHWFPFIPGSFMNLPFVTSQVRKYTGMELQPVPQILEIINGILLVALLWLAWKFIIKKSFVSTASSNRMITWGIAGTLAVFFTLIFLSFTYKIQKGYFNNWNYISETRYFAFVIVFTQLLFLGWVFLNERKEKNFYQKTILYVCFLLLFIEITHNLYFHTRVALQFRKFKNEIYREQDYNYFNSLLDTLKKNNPGADILVPPAAMIIIPALLLIMEAKEFLIRYH